MRRPLCALPPAIRRMILITSNMMPSRPDQRVPAKRRMTVSLTTYADELLAHTLTTRTRKKSEAAPPAI
ncbi:hypothetical protein F2P81_011126 [Scophthalmus maximus]|uniref:Uncharacterized protein n=1 Tax=Scophthalmus maximus TaxID=52904 RepID=A0A6A4SXQ2_SCOMX|nr:hypothetical protein F2P81_011126 [Scophthalmus maximus]